MRQMEYSKQLLKTISNRKVFFYNFYDLNIYIFSWYIYPGALSL